MEIANITTVLRGNFSFEREPESFDILHYAGGRCIQDFLEESLRTVNPQSKVKITVEVFDK